MFDYSSITAESVEEITNEAIDRAERLAEQVATADQLTFETVLAPLDAIVDIVRGAQGQAEFVKQVHPDEAVRDAARDAGERLKRWDQFPESPRSIEVAFRPEINDAVQRYAFTEEAAGLTGEKARLLDFVQTDLRLVGHQLDESTQARLRELSDRLVSLSTEFSRNIAEYQDTLLLGDDDIGGLPGQYVDSLELDEESGKRQVTMAYPHVIPFMENSIRRDLREQLSFKFNTRAVDENRPILEEAIQSRLEMAKLLGFESWADRVLSTRMARTKNRVDAMYEGLVPSLTEKAEAEIAKVSLMLAADGGDTQVQLWDWDFYHTQIKKTEYGVDPAKVAAYLPMQAVLDGMFEITSEVFGITYSPIEAPVWHEDVLVYDVADTASGEQIGTFYLDLHPREGKFTHAAVFPLVARKLLDDGSYQKPTAAMLCNFTKPTETAPSLLQHSEVETLFHEFGHILHDILGQGDFARFSGAYTEWDFVEAPSQIMQHWIWRPEVLRRFARHYETDEPIPESLVEGLVAARQLNRGMAYLRQIRAGMLDQDLHGPEESKDIDAILRNATTLTMLPFHEGTFFPASFGHLMGGYDAAYYGYLWSEVFGDDMFSRFEEEGVTDPGVGMDYRTTVIGRGGTVDADEMLRDFLGREPNNAAFLRKAGIA